MRREIEEAKQKIRNAVIKSITPIMEADVWWWVKVKGCSALSCHLFLHSLGSSVVLECLPRSLVTFSQRVYGGH